MPARKSHGTSRVPWCSSWKNACWPLVPGSPQTIGAVGASTALALAIDALAVALHVELLQVGRQPMQVLFVRQHGVRLGAEHARVPHAQQPEHHRQVALDRRGPEVLVHLVRAVEELLEVPEAGGQRDRQADRRPQRVAAADPVPEHEHVLGRDAELADRGLVGRDGDEVPGDRRPASLARARNHSRAECALAMVSCVVNVFDATVNSVVAGCSGRSVSARCVPSTFDTKCSARALARVRRQRLRDHGRTEVRAADADVDHVGDAQARCSPARMPPRTASVNVRM